MRRAIALRSLVSDTRRFAANPLYKNGVFAMMTAGAVSLLGALFWLIVARAYPSDQVGLANAVISSAGLVGMFSKLGLDFSLMRYLPVQVERKSTLNSSFTIVILACLAVAVVFVVGLKAWSPKLSFIQTNAAMLTAFLVFAPLNAVLMVQHAAFVGLRSAKYSLLENAVVGVTKLPLPLALLAFGLTGIVLSWGLGIVIGVVLASIVFLPRLVPHYTPRLAIQRSIVQPMLRFSVGNYVADTLETLPGLVFPLMIVNLLSPSENAYFFVAWMVAGVLTNIPLGICSSLLAEGFYEPERRKANVVRALKFTFALLVPAVLAIAVVAGPLLGLLGQEYRGNALQILWLLAISSFPLAVVRVYVTYKRMQSRLFPVIAVYALESVSVLILSFLLLPRMGLEGIGVAWASTQAAAALIVVFLLVKKERWSIAGIN